MVGKVGKHVGADSVESLLEDCGNGDRRSSAVDEENFLSLILIFIHLFYYMIKIYVYLSFSKIMQVSSKRILLSSLV